MKWQGVRPFGEAFENYARLWVNNNSFTKRLRKTMLLKEPRLNFTDVMNRKAQEKGIQLDNDQQRLIRHLETLAETLLRRRAAFAGLYLWGQPGRGKSFIVDSFFAALPLAQKKRAHFHTFFRELHQQLNGQGLDAALLELMGEARLLCFDEFHLHDIGDAMLVKRLIALAIARNVALIFTSNYPPRALLANPLYHDRFVPSIALIERHMTVMALNGPRDYRQQATGHGVFSEGAYLWPASAARRQALGLPDASGAVALTVGHRTLHAASSPGEFLHFTFAGLCEAPTAVMDYLALCEGHERWFLDGVPPLARVSPAAQQRFINLVDVLYDQQRRLFIAAACPLTELVAGVEQEDIARTASRLSQLTTE